MSRKDNLSSFAVPTANDAEFAILCALATIPEETIGEISSIVKAEDFHQDHYRDIYVALRYMIDTKKSISRFTLRDELPGMQVEIIDSIFMSVGAFGTDLTAACRLVQKKSNLRKLRAILHQGLIQTCGEFDDPEMLASSLMADISNLTEAPNRESKPMIEVLDLSKAEHEALAARGDYIGIKTGKAKLDKYLKGLQRKVFTLIGGPTSHGKTAFAVDLLQGAVIENPTVHGALFSLEMSGMQIADRVRANRARIPLDRVREWMGLSEFDHSLLAEVHDLYRDIGRRYVFNDALRNIDEVIADSRRLKQKHGLDVVMVDYLQLLEGSADERTRERVVNQIAWKLFNLSKELDIAVIALSQVTTDATKRMGQRLSVDDLRESKATGHHARTVLLISRSWAYDKLNSMNAPCDTLVQVEKNSEGVVGDVQYHFDGPTQRFWEGNCDDCKCEWRVHEEGTRGTVATVQGDHQSDLLGRSGGTARRRRPSDEAEAIFSGLGFRPKQ